MRIALPGRPHLSYCTNIHPAETLEDVRGVLLEHVTRVITRIRPDGEFGVGLRLSARAAEELDDPAEIDRFRALLSGIGAYVFTINGFPYGAFHGTRIKEQVYLPDWRDDARVAYSDRLARILAALLPEGVSGSVSTVPGAFAPLASADGDRRAIAERLVRHAAACHRIREETGKSVELALEPEPACLLETVHDTCRFFEDYVFSARSVEALARAVGVTESGAESALRRHIGVCVDACHLAVEFESARDAVARLSRAGIRIGKIQITDALVARFTGEPNVDERLLSELERFSDEVYLHQVVERCAGAMTRYLDLPDAIRKSRHTPHRGPCEWRIHFHVPIFREALPPFSSTQPFLRELFEVLRTAPVTEHLEVETYTWDVLPPEHRSGAVEDAIARELEFAVGLASAPPPRQDEP